MSDPFDFGDVVICERCSASIPSSEVEHLKLTLFTAMADERWSKESSFLLVCPACLRKAMRGKARAQFWESSLILIIVGLLVLCLVGFLARLCLSYLWGEL